jgi:hypothetical protein
MVMCSSCNFIEQNIDHIRNPELYEKTDHFVGQLQTTYESYGVLGGTEFKVVTSDGEFQIMPTGRLINVKILRVAEPGEYEQLRQRLESHYKDDPRVNSVYIAQAGTVMIDCRK